MAASPALTSELVSTGKSGRVPSARAPKPKAVPQAKGIPNQALPPKKYARAVFLGWEAIALDQ